jgi:putative acetyltransferase
MKLRTRKATVTDVPRMWELRRDSILTLAPRGMTMAQAETWANSMAVEGMEQRFRDAEVWVAEVDDRIAGWIALRGDYIDGLYTDPRFVERGIGTDLVALAEALMRERGIHIIRLEASVNAEQFYLRRGFVPKGSRVPDSAIPMEKRLFTT